MRRSLLGFLVIPLALAVGGCHGPKSDCEGTMRSFEAIIDGNSWDDFPGVVYAPLRKKFGDKHISRGIAEYYEGARSFKFTGIQTSVSKDVCFAQTTATWTQKIRGHNPNTYSDEYYSYTLHLVDGKWYMELPGTGKLSAW